VAEGKYINKTNLVEVDGVDLSIWAFSLDTPSSKATVDVSGFNPNGTAEQLTGQRTDTATVGFNQSFATGGPHQTLYPLYDGDVEFTLIIKKDATQPTSADNPELRGRAKLLDYNGMSGQLNARGEFTCNFVAADEFGLKWYDAVS
jgi:hypothetical protein